MFWVLLSPHKLKTYGFSFSNIWCYCKVQAGLEVTVACIRIIKQTHDSDPRFSEGNIGGFLFNRYLLHLVIHGCSPFFLDTKVESLGVSASHSSPWFFLAKYKFYFGEVSYFLLTSSGVVNTWKTLDISLPLFISCHPRGDLISHFLRQALGVSLPPIYPLLLYKKAGAWRARLHSTL